MNSITTLQQTLPQYHGPLQQPRGIMTGLVYSPRAASELGTGAASTWLDQPSNIPAIPFDQMNSI